MLAPSLLSSELAAAGPTRMARYLGRSNYLLISDPVRERAIQQTMKATQAVELLTRNARDWTDIKNELLDTSVLLMDPEILLPQYKLELLSDALCPYLATMRSRISVSSSRLSQLQAIFQALDLHANRAGTLNHPAAVLLDIEQIIRAINEESTWFKSDLATKLTTAASSQWVCILTPLRSDLQGIALKLIFLSLIEFARPLVLAWPLLLVSKEALLLVQAREDTQAGVAKPVDMYTAISQMVKPVLLLLIVYQVTSILSLLTGSGYFFGVTGILLLIFQSSDAMLKPHVPMIAEQIAPFLDLVDKIHHLETKFLGTPGSLSETSTGPQIPSPNVRPKTQRELVEQTKASKHSRDGIFNPPEFQNKISFSANKSGITTACVTSQATGLSQAMSGFYTPLVQLVTSIASSDPDTVCLGETNNINQNMCAGIEDDGSCTVNSSISSEAGEEHVEFIGSELYGSTDYTENIATRAGDIDLLGLRRRKRHDS